MLRPAAMTRSLGSLVSAGCLFALSWHGSPALAQQFLLGDGCDSLPPCEGSTCPGADDHPVVSARGCFCAPGATGDTLAPPACCTGPAGSTGSCGSGMVCTLFTDAPGGLCIPTGGNYCNTATSVSLAMARACHTTPGGTYTLAWGAGDCDDDGVPNGAEAADPLRDECVHDDVANCMALDLGTPAACCALADDLEACCIEAGIDPVECCAPSRDFASCCADVAGATGGATMLECCLASPSTEPSSCCATLTDGLTGVECCEALGGPHELCCEVGIVEAALCTDAGATDADANVAVPDGGAVLPGVDAGAMDAGPGSLPPDGVGFGGGGGCRCGVGAPARPSLLALLAGLAIAVPALARRRR